MRIIYTISKEEAEEISRVRKNIKDKQTDKQLYAVELQGRGKNNKEIAEKLDTSTKVVSHWVSAYKNGGIEALLSKRKCSNRWNISFEEKEKLLSKF
ncbi:MAG: helix-turn-helix domain-containing protein [Acutalibacteraceae bacterium]|nr:helix-turn-helix domain-containing protein [Acutalibacteraceae bacterium]